MNKEIGGRAKKILIKKEAALAPARQERAVAKQAAAKEEERRSRHEMRRIHRWRRMYLEGDRKGLKKDAGAVMGAVYAKVEEMVRRINVDGLMIPTAKMISSERGGKRIVYELIPHPLLDPLFKAIKILHLDPVEFGLTPAAAEGSAPKGAIQIGKVDINVVNAQLDEKTRAFMGAMERAKTLRASDPVFRDFVQLASAVEVARSAPESFPDVEG